MTCPTVLVVTGAKNVFEGNVAGVIGLGTNRIPATPPGMNFTAQFTDSIFGQWLYLNPNASSISVGMNIAPPIITPKNTSSIALNMAVSSGAGQLDWLQPNTTAYNTTQVATKIVQTLSGVTYMGNSSSQPDWTVGLEAWSFASSSAQVSNEEVMPTTVDPYYTGIYFPLEQARLLSATAI